MSSSKPEADQTVHGETDVGESGPSRHGGGVEEAGVDIAATITIPGAKQSDQNLSPLSKESSVATNDPDIDPVNTSLSALAISASDKPNDECCEADKQQSSADVPSIESSVSVLASPESVCGSQRATEQLEKPLSESNDLAGCSKISSQQHSEGSAVVESSLPASKVVSHPIPIGEGIEASTCLAADKSTDNSSSLDGNGTGKPSEEKQQTPEDSSPKETAIDSCEAASKTSSSAGVEKGTGKPAATAASSVDSDDEKQSIYQVKWIKHKGSTMPIITQNENGPCPLLAIINLLLLQGKIKLPSGAEVVTSNELTAYLADWIFEHVPKNISEDTRLNYEQNMHDAIAVFPKLQTGLDVNVRFTGVSEFEYTPECIVFDLLDVPLYHGWLVDPQMPDLVSAIGNSTYNQLVEKIILQKNCNKEELVAEAILAEEFLNVTASQLTYHGLSELSATIKEEEMCVLFRNNHFSTLYKHKNELFVLVTDQGFLRESNVVWETLSNIEGDGHFVDADFRTYRIPESTPPTLPTPAFPVNSKEQIDHDYLVALSLEQEQSEVQPGTQWSDSATLSDHELALRLQEEENMNADSASRQSGTRQPKPTDTQAVTASGTGTTGSGGTSGSGSKDKKESSCMLM